MVNYPMIDPRSRVLVSGGALNYGMSGYLQGHDAAGGALLWQVQLPSDLGNNLTIAGRSRFARSGHTVYAPVMMFGYNESDFYWYLYALRTDDAWEDLGHALAGPAGVPVLRGDGPLTGGSPLTVTLTGARPARPGVLFVGFAALNAPLLGGVLVPRPDVPLFWTTDGAGAASFRVTWPAGVPAGFSIWYQAWTADPGAPQGVSASNALRSVSQ
jgi:hypothetical protein